MDPTLVRFDSINLGNLIVIVNSNSSASKESPLVSVCIGTFNREDYIRECLDSVFAQTYENYEVVIADNASTDRTVEIAESYGSRVRVIRRSENSGTCSTTRNEAVRNARGDYVAFLDSDDSWLPDKLLKQVAFMGKFPDVPLCHAYAEVIDENSVSQGIRHEGAIPTTGRIIDDLLEHCFITISSVMIRRALYVEIGPFREDPPYGQSGEDYDFFMRVAGRYPIGFIPEVLIRYRKSSAGITHGNWQATPKPLVFLREVARAPDAAYPGISRRMRKAAFVNACRINSDYWLGQGDPGKARWAAAQGWKSQPAHPILAGLYMKSILLELIKIRDVARM